MIELVCITLDGIRYAVRAERVLSREHVLSLHRLPFADPRGGVLAMIGQRPETLADLSACLGHSPTPATGSVHALLLSKDPPVRGFVVGGEPVDLAVADDALIPVPGCLHGPPLEGFLLHESSLLPVIDIMDLFARVCAGEWHAPRIRLVLSPVPAQPCDPSIPYRVFLAGGLLYAFAARRRWEAWRVGALFTSPLLPPAIDGISVTEGTAVPVLDVARRMGGSAPPATLAVLAPLGETPVAVLVDEDRGIWEPGSAACRDLPPLACARGVTGILQRHDEAALLLDLDGLLSSVAVPGGPPRHALASDFPSRFRRGEVDVLEVVLLGRRHALPRSEARAVVARIPSMKVPHAPPVVAGVADFEGNLLPVLDLSMGFGLGRGETGPDMIVLESGDFHALLLVEKVLQERHVRRDDQRPVPYAASHPFLYGCYVDGEAVRLIFNIAAIAMQFSLQPGRDAQMTLARAFGFAQEGGEALPGRVDRAPAENVGMPLEADTSIRGAAFAPPEGAVPPAHAPHVEAAEPPPAPPEGAAPPADALHVEAAEPPTAPPQGAAPPADALHVEAAEPLTSPPQGAAVPPQGALPQGAAPPAESAPVRPEGVAAPADTPHPDAPVPLMAQVSPEVTSPQSPAFSEVAEGRPEPGTVESMPEEPRRQEAAARAAERPQEERRTRPAGMPSEREENASVETERAQGREQAGRPVRRSPPRRTKPLRWLAIAVAALMVLAAVVILLVPSIRVGVFPPATSRPAATEAPPKPPATETQGTGGLRPAEAGVPNEYVVTEGDTLWGIAARFTGNPYNYLRLATENSITNPDRIFPGQMIRLAPK